MVRDVTDTPREASSTEASTRPARAHRRRFAAAFGVLAAVLVAAIVATVVLLLATDRPEAFSAFAPTASDPVDRAQQIGDFVAARYASTPGTPLVEVRAGETDNPILPGAPTLVALDTSPPLGLFAFEPGDILFYKLCPTGPAPCTLDAAADRRKLGPVYAREALELALYGLKYVKEAESVMVILPTGYVPTAKPEDSPRIGHYFRRRDLANKLDRPLARTLSGDPPTPSTLDPTTVAEIDALTKGTRYRLQTTTSEDKTFNIIVISPTG